MAAAAALSGPGARTAARRGDVPVWRLNLLRAVYLLIAVGLSLQIWPAMVLRSASWELMEGVVACMLGAFSLLSLAGLRHPLRMLPIMFWEMIWKGLWLLVVFAPRWASGRVDEGVAATAFACAVAVVVPLAVPWRHVARTYLAGPGDRWR